MILYSTFIAGFEKVIGDILGVFDDIEVLSLFSGAVIYEYLGSQADFSAENYKFFNNTYIVLYSAKMKEKNAENIILRHMLSKGNTIDYKLPKRYTRHKTFRIMCYHNNTPALCDNNLKASLESLIKTSTNVKPERGDAGHEYCVMYRGEGIGLFLARLTDNTTGKNRYGKGELRSELCYLLNLLSKPAGDDVYLDPFAGSGALPVSRVRDFPEPVIINIADCDENKVNVIKKILPDVNFYTSEIRDLHKCININTVNKIVTDPPWGIYDKNLDSEKIMILYSDMIEVFDRICVSGASIVLLVSQKGPLDDILFSFIKKFEVDLKLNILVSGKKASVYRIIKK